MSESIDVPVELTSTIFPWVEMEKLALESRRNEAGRKADDPRLLHLLNLLIFFRNVILQDAAILYSKYPNCPLFDYHPFTTPLFHSFAMTIGPLLEAAETEARHRLENLPEQFTASLRGIVTTFTLENQKLNQVLNEQTNMLKLMESRLDATGSTSKQPPRKRRRGVYPFKVFILVSRALSLSSCMFL